MHCASAEQPMPRFDVEINHGWIDGPGIRIPPSEFRIPAIDSGRRSALSSRWHIDEHWYVLGNYERMRLSYENPLDLVCPWVVSGLNIVPFPYLCPLGGLPRDGLIKDKVHHGRLGIGWTPHIAEKLQGLIELGYGRMQWDSDEDVEASAAARCQTLSPEFFSEGYDAPLVDIPGCTPVASNATADGLTAKLGLIFDLPAGFAVSAAWNYQGYRHKIYRNDVLPRYNDANVELCDGQCSTPAVLLRQPSGAWHWYQARVSYDFSERWGLFVDAEGGGNRDWDIYSIGARVSF
jgi:hypothetical protein